MLVMYLIPQTSELRSTILKNRWISLITDWFYMFLNYIAWFQTHESPQNSDFYIDSNSQVLCLLTAFYLDGKNNQANQFFVGGIKNGDVSQMSLGEIDVVVS